MRARGNGRRPDLVDRVELAERLGVSGATMGRWHRRAVLPEPDLRFGPQEVWLWDTIQEWAKKRGTFRKGRRTIQLPEIVDIETLATRLGIETRPAETWQKNGFLPEPDYRWEQADGWLWQTIQAWERTPAAGRVGGRDSLPSPPPRRHNPSGPRLRPATPSEPAGDGKEGAPPAPATEAAPPPPSDGAVDVTPVPPADPVNEMLLIQEHFASVAEGLRHAEPDRH